MTAPLPAWLLEVLACPVAGCGGALAPRDGVAGELHTGALRCAGCASLYPVLAGVPVLVPDPASWMAAYRESVLATLVELGAAGPAAAEVVASFAAARRGVEPLRFGDDWVDGEAEQDEGAIAPPDGEEARLFAAFLAAARRGGGPAAAIDELCGDGERGCVVELGCGAGTLSARLRARARRLVVADLSLRAAARAGAQAQAAAGGLCAAAVLDAEQPAVAAGAADAVVAVNLVDLLEQPESFVTAAAEILAPEGRLLVATPAPDLGVAGEPALLEHVLGQAGFEIERALDAVPWVRAHGARHFQVYFCAVLSARLGA
jgi:SAM-dependent methyltransferase/uncharacterized protein YbaR (Trm112 family)